MGKLSSSLKKLVVGLSLGMALSACEPVSAVLGVGAVTGLVIYEERDAKTIAKDLAIDAAITDSWFRFEHTMPLSLGIEVFEGRVLVTGAVTSEQVRADAIRLAWEADGVKQVINEVQISNSGIADSATDSWITTQIKTKLTLDKEIFAINYSVETVNGIVYLIGIAQNAKELDRVIAHARNIAHVRKVISHVRVKGTPAKG